MVQFNFSRLYIRPQRVHYPLADGTSFDRRMCRSRVSNGTRWTMLVAAINSSAGSLRKSSFADCLTAIFVRRASASHPGQTGECGRQDSTSHLTPVEKISPFTFTLFLMLPIRSAQPDAIGIGRATGFPCLSLLDRLDPDGIVITKQ
jgi:hypothetical protein